MMMKKSMKYSIKRREIRLLLKNSDLWFSLQDILTLSMQSLSLMSISTIFLSKFYWSTLPRTTCWMFRLNFPQPLKSWSSKKLCQSTWDLTKLHRFELKFVLPLVNLDQSMDISTTIIKQVLNNHTSSLNR